MLKNLDVIKIPETEISKDQVLKDVILKCSTNKLHQLYELSYQDNFKYQDIINIFRDLIENKEIIKRYTDLRNLTGIIDIIHKIRSYLNIDNYDEEVKKFNHLEVRIYEILLTYIYDQFTDEMDRDINCFFATETDSKDLSTIFLIFKNLSFNDKSSEIENNLVKTLLDLIDVEVTNPKFRPSIDYYLTCNRFIEKISCIYTNRYIESYLFDKFLMMSIKLINKDFKNWYIVYSKLNVKEKLETYIKTDKYTENRDQIAMNFVDSIFDVADNVFEMDNYKSISLCEAFLKLFTVINEMNISVSDGSSDNKTLEYKLCDKIRKSYSNILIKNDIYLQLYFCLSLSKFTNEGETKSIDTLAKFQRFNESIDEFFIFYLKEMKRRILADKINLELESKIVDIFNSTFYNNQKLKSINNCLIDIEMSKDITKNLRTVEIINKYSKNMEYDIDKLHVFTGASMFWSESIDNVDKLEGELEIYGRIVGSYYKKLCPDKKISYNRENTRLYLSFGKTKIKSSYIHYLIFKEMSENENIVLSKLANKINVKENRLKSIIDNMIYRDVITDEFKINEDIYDTKQSINLTIDEIDNEQIKEEIMIDRLSLIKCYIVKILKKNMADKKEDISENYEGLFTKSCEKLKGWFVLDKKPFDECLNKLLQLGFVNKKDDIYTYIP